MGARAYRYLSLYDPAPGCLVEVGSERGEGSTAFLAAYAAAHRLRFYTADIDPESHEAAKQLTSGARLVSGTTLLHRLKTPISIAYLDGFDWIPEGAEHEGWIHYWRTRYQHLGYELTNENSQREHLQEAQAVAAQATDRAVVIMDDTWLDGHEWTGKGGLAVPHLLSHGFRVVDHVGCKPESLGYTVMRRG